MTNLAKLQEVLPDDWNKFDIPLKWAEAEYTWHPSMYHLIQYYFGDTDLATTDEVWDKEMYNEDNIDK